MQRVDVWNVKTGCVVKSIRRDFLCMTRFGVVHMVWQHSLLFLLVLAANLITCGYCMS